MLTSGFGALWWSGLENLNNAKAAMENVIAYAAASKGNWVTQVVVRALAGSLWSFGLQNSFCMVLLQAVSALFQQLLFSAAQQLYSRTSHGGTAVAFDLGQVTSQLSLTNGTALATFLRLVNDTAVANANGTTINNTELFCSASANNSSSTGSNRAQGQSTGTINSGRRLLQTGVLGDGSAKRQLLLSADAKIRDVSMHMFCNVLWHDLHVWHDIKCPERLHSAATHNDPKIQSDIHDFRRSAAAQVYNGTGEVSVTLMSFYAGQRCYWTNHC